MGSISTIWMVGGVIVAVFLIVRIAKDPLTFFGALLRNVVVGCVALLVLDYLGKGMGVHVPLNFTTAGVAGVLGVPGIAALAVLTKWII